MRHSMGSWWIFCQFCSRLQGLEITRLTTITPQTVEERN